MKKEEMSTKEIRFGVIMVIIFYVVLAIATGPGEYKLSNDWAIILISVIPLLAFFAYFLLQRADSIKVKVGNIELAAEGLLKKAVQLEQSDYIDSNVFIRGDENLSHNGPFVVVRIVGLEDQIDWWSLQRFLVNSPKLIGIIFCLKDGKYIGFIEVAKIPRTEWNAHKNQLIKDFIRRYGSNIHIELTNMDILEIYKKMNKHYVSILPITELEDLWGIITEGNINLELFTQLSRRI